MVKQPHLQLNKEGYYISMAHLFTLQLCQLQLKDEPEKFISWVVRVEEQPEVLVHAVVHIQADHSQAG